jgi:hypothetical protein
MPKPRVEKKFLNKKMKVFFETQKDCGRAYFLCSVKRWLRSSASQSTTLLMRGAGPPPPHLVEVEYDEPSTTDSES